MTTRVSELYGRPWSERDLIIALDAYFRNQAEPRHRGAEWIRRTAAVIYRTPASVLMRMENYASVDPDVTERKALNRGGPSCERVFFEWTHRRDHLRSCAEVLIRESSGGSSLELFEPEAVRIPQAFGKYELMDFLGEGAFGFVFSCVREDGRAYAIKLIKADRVQDSESLHRFLREIRALKSVRHPNVICLYEDNLESERHFPGFIMDLAAMNLTEYVGRRAKERDRTKARPVLNTEEAAEIVLSIMSAVEGLHDHTPQIVHRDINPNNILLLPGGGWVLADFGLAKFISSAPLTTSFSTHSQQVWATAYYAPPEQYEDFGNCTAQTDVYALGTLIWELFGSGWPPPDKADPGLPPGIRSIYLKATARNPQSRYESVADLADEFRFAISRLL